MCVSTKYAVAGLAMLMAVTGPACSKEIIIVPDHSDSAPIAVNQQIANMAANLVYSKIATMKMGDMVKIRSLGTYGVASQGLYANIRLSRKARPHKVAGRIYRIIRSLPSLVKTGRIKLQPETNIIGFLEAIAPSLDCHARPATILIFTDGIEHSSFISQHELITGRKKLPAPSGRILEGCTLEMRGLGQQRKSLTSNPKWFRLLKKEWAGFAKAAGVARFRAYAEYR